MYASWRVMMYLGRGWLEEGGREKREGEAGGMISFTSSSS